MDFIGKIKKIVDLSMAEPWNRYISGRYWRNSLLESNNIFPKFCFGSTQQESFGIAVRIREFYKSVCVPEILEVDVQSHDDILKIENLEKRKMQLEIPFAQLRAFDEIMNIYNLEIM